MAKKMVVLKNQKVKNDEVQNETVEKQEQPKIEETKQEQVTVENKEQNTQEEQKDLKDDVLNNVVESETPVPYNVTVNGIVYELRIRNKDELLVVVNRITGYSNNFKIEKIERLR